MNQPSVSAAAPVPLQAPAMRLSQTTCASCQAVNPPGSRFCGQCASAIAPARARLPSADEAGSLLRRTGDGVASRVGLQRVRGFSLGDLLSEVFKRRGVQEVENHLLAGTAQATPAVDAIETDWPRPWLFARMIFVSVLVYALFYLGLALFRNPNLLPGLIIVGAFAIPTSVLVLFYELNTPRNVSMLVVVRLLVIGGTWSLLVSLVLFEFGGDLGSLVGASSAGFIEETGKLAAVIYATRRLSPVRYRYTLNGMLFGAAVGAGFAAFETAGYAYRALVAGGIGSMTDIITMRGLLSPFAHVLWTAIAAGALWRIKGARSFDSLMLASASFLRLFMFSVLCHFIWNAGMPGILNLLKILVLGLVGWWVALSMVQDGLRQVRREQEVAGGILSRGGQS